MMKEILVKLQQVNDPMCATIVVKTDREYPGSRQNPIRLKNAAKEIRAVVGGQADNEAIDKFIARLEKYLGQIPDTHAGEGLGVYFSDSVAETVELPLEVEEVISLGDSFNTFAIEDAIENSKHYHVLAISRNQSRLLRGVNNVLTEVENETFPMAFKNEFQVKRSDPGAFYTDEESKIDQSRLDEFLRSLDQALGQVLKGERLPVFLLGVEEELSGFMAVSKHKDAVAGQVAGNYDRASLKELSGLIPADRLP